MKLIVLNLPREFDEQKLESMFKVHGPVISCSLVIDQNRGVSKGFGFIEMEHEDDAMIAIEKLHGKKMKQSRIRVKPAE